MTRDRPRAGAPHGPDRPSWRCRACAHPWPCGPAKLDLVRTYAGDPVGLCVYLCAQLHDAVADLCAADPAGQPDAGALFTRFIGWALRRRD
ncbi:hypothetical protein SAMN05444365_10111 [Micromonospora pattaloongensis]|uniref:Flavin reductase n=1 Tax=Micromonospora pattaloongensis TaxID=405436 RepID=A0A1H3FHB9_9ACTN|nr:hypothetical protein [Micromonospora pattaloongensis]SDX90401.1 hypothetical protein SAMN05444365_10111 [Micromonospora pattaloongensis]